ncbi:hypothetical protein PHYPSEUDO_008506 [Phytophthora pseudosyringae]|uniref:Uncharacterized protein n=1 Tax=Phytophthora pseudosyringae TaxID=221518 RepID=A0A8T1VH86_9STRA|nr:hypothetical protein PHYPSEUDO_008506 [Phytophthora pseudosyringae]
MSAGARRSHFALSTGARLSHLPPLPPSQSQIVVDLRVRRQASSGSSSSNSDDARSECDVDVGRNALVEDGDESGHWDVGFRSNYGENENLCNLSNADVNATSVLPRHDAMTVEARTIEDRKIRQRFGPEEDYLLAVQVNVDAPYMAEHGEVNKQCQALTDKLNGSPNFNMKAIKG